MARSLFQDHLSAPYVDSVCEGLQSLIPEISPLQSMDLKGTEPATHFGIGPKEWSA